MYRQRYPGREDTVIGCLVSTLAFAGIPRDLATALDRSEPTEDRARAIVALADAGAAAELATVESTLRTVVGPHAGRGEAGWLGHVATAGRLQVAQLEDLTEDRAWPAWTAPHVRQRMAELLPERCADPALRTLALPPAAVVDACAAELSPTALATDLAISASVATRAQSARILAALAAVRPYDVGTALGTAFAWRSPDDCGPEAPCAGDPAERFVGNGGLTGAIPLPTAARHHLATELVTWRIQLTLVGDQLLPARLEDELLSLLAPELDHYGVPTNTVDWLHLLSAAGGDPELVLVRLNLRNDGHWSGMLDVDQALDESPREMLPLLAHRSPVVRERAAARLERSPTASVMALRRAWRLAPGRGAPLRGDVGSPSLPRTEAGAERWARTLVRWARRCSRQNDDTALRATMWILSQPATTTELTETARLLTAESLLRTARKDPSPARAESLVQGMDAVLRGVTFDLGASPAPDDAAVAPPTAGASAAWTRQTELLAATAED